MLFCWLLVVFVGVVEGGTVVSNTLKTLTVNGESVPSRVLLVNFDSCLNVGGDQIVRSFQSENQTLQLVGECLPPLIRTSVVNKAIVPEFIYDSKMDSSTMSVTAGAIVTEFNRLLEFALGYTSESNTPIHLRRLLQESTSTDPAFVLNAQNVKVQTAAQSRRECRDKSWEHLQTLSPSETDGVKLFFRSTNTSVLLSSVSKPTYDAWFADSPEFQFTELQLIRDTTMQNAVPDAYCEIDPDYNATLYQRAIDSNAGPEFRSTQMNYPDGVPCVPESLNVVISPSVRADLLAKAQSVNVPDTEIMRDMAAIITKLSNPAPLTYFTLIDRTLMSNTLYNSNPFSIAIKNQLSSSLIYSNGMDGTNPRLDPALLNAGDPSEILPRLKYGDYYKPATPCPCAMQAYSNEFRSCTINPWHAYSQDDGRIPDRYMGVTQQCTEFNGGWACAALMLNAQRRDLSPLNSTKYCSRNGKLMTKAEWKRAETRRYNRAKKRGFNKIVNTEKKRKDCSSWTVSFTDNRQVLADSQVRALAIDGQADMNLAFFTGRTRTVELENGTRVTLTENDFLNLINIQGAAVLNLSATVANEQSAMLSIIPTLAAQAQLAVEKTSVVKKTVDTLVDSLNQQLVVVNKFQDDVVKSYDTLRAQLQANAVELNATGIGLQVQIDTARDIVSNHTMNIRSLRGAFKLLVQQVRQLQSVLIDYTTRRTEQETVITRANELLQTELYNVTGRHPFVYGETRNMIYGPRQLTKEEDIKPAEFMRVTFMSPAFFNLTANPDPDATQGIYDTPVGIHTRLHQLSLRMDCSIDHLKKYVIDDFNAEDVFLALGPAECELGAFNDNACRCQIRIVRRSCDIELSPSALLVQMRADNSSFSNELSSSNTCGSNPVHIDDNATIDTDGEYQVLIQHMCQGLSNTLNMAVPLHTVDNKTYTIYSWAADSRVLTNDILSYYPQFCATSGDDMLANAKQTGGYTITSKITQLLALGLRNVAASPNVAYARSITTGRSPPGMSMSYHDIGASSRVDQQENELPLVMENAQDPNTPDELDPSGFDSQAAYEAAVDEMKQYQEKVDNSGVKFEYNNATKQLKVYYIDPATQERIYDLPPILKATTTTKYSQKKRIYSVRFVSTGPHSTVHRQIVFKEVIPRVRFYVRAAGNISQALADRLTTKIQSRLTQSTNIQITDHNVKLFTTGGAIDHFGYLDCELSNSNSTDLLDGGCYSVKRSDFDVVTNRSRTYYTYNVDYVARYGKGQVTGSAVNYIHLLIPDLELAARTGYIDGNNSLLGGGTYGASPLVRPSVWRDDLSGNNRMSYFPYEEMMEQRGWDPLNSIPQYSNDYYDANLATVSLDSFRQSLVSYVVRGNNNISYILRRCANKPVHWKRWCQILANFRPLVGDVSLYGNETNPNKYKELYFESIGNQGSVITTVYLPDDVILTALSDLNTQCPKTIAFRFEFSTSARVMFTLPFQNHYITLRLAISSSAANPCATSEVVQNVFAEGQDWSLPVGACVPKTMQLYVNSTLCWTYEAPLGVVNGTDQPGLANFTYRTEDRYDEWRVRSTNVVFTMSSQTGRINNLQLTDFASRVQNAGLTLQVIPNLNASTDERGVTYPVDSNITNSSALNQTFDEPLNDLDALSAKWNAIILAVNQQLDANLELQTRISENEALAASTIRNNPSALQSLEDGQLAVDTLLVDSSQLSEIVTNDTLGDMDDETWNFVLELSKTKYATETARQHKENIEIEKLALYLEINEHAKERRELGWWNFNNERLTAAHAGGVTWNITIWTYIFGFIMIGIMNLAGLLSMYYGSASLQPFNPLADYGNLPPGNPNPPQARLTTTQTSKPKPSGNSVEFVPLLTRRR